MNHVLVSGLIATAAIATQTPYMDNLIKRYRVLAEAKRLMGTRYIWGGETPEDGMDCSGYIQYTIKKALGIDIPRVITDQQNNAPYRLDINGMGYAEVKRILKPGDCISLNYDKKGSCDHGGFYKGKGRVYHSSGGQSCPYSSLPCKVIEADLDRWVNSWWTIYSWTRKPNR